MSPWIERPVYRLLTVRKEWRSAISPSLSRLRALAQASCLDHSAAWHGGDPLGLKPVFGEDRYRTQSEDVTLDALVFDGWRFELAEGRIKDAREGARRALNRCLDLGLPYMTSPQGYRLFDPVEVTNFLKWAGLTDQDSIWQDHCLATARRQAWRGRGGSADHNQAPVLPETTSADYLLSLQRTFSLRDRKPGASIRLRLPAPLEGPDLQILSLVCRDGNGKALQAQLKPGALDIKGLMPTSGHLRASVLAEVRIRPWQPDPSATLTAEDRALFSRPSEGLVQVTPRLVRFAEVVRRGITDPFEIVQAYWDHLMDNFALGAIHYDQLDPDAPLDWALDHGWYDCKLGSALLVALCRAGEIPARLVSGYLLYEEAPGFHTWLEIWIEGRGWLPMDLACWNLANGGTDRAWRNHFFGRLDHRVTTERLPRIFGGTGSVRLPASWQMLLRLEGPGAQVTFQDLATGAEVYREDITVARLKAPAT